MSSVKLSKAATRISSTQSWKAGRSIPALASRQLTTASTTAPATGESDGRVLPWSEYLSIRRGKRRWEIATTIPATVGGLAGGLSYFGALQSDPSALILGIEPVWVYLAATLACAGGGYLVGPLIGNSMWRATHRKKVALIDAREREFHQHIVRNRVDPSRQSATNPVPDYYGENIGSLKDYRQWLRDQNKYRRKAAWPEEDA